jgi:hypothetical protein
LRLRCGNIASVEALEQAPQRFEQLRVSRVAMHVTLFRSEAPVLVSSTVKSGSGRA